MSSMKVVAYKAGPWTIYKDGSAFRESPIGLIFIGRGFESLHEVRRQGGEPLIRADYSDLAESYVELSEAIDAADRAIAQEVAKQEAAPQFREKSDSAPSECEQEELTLEEMTELIRQLRLRLMCDSDVNSSNVGAFAEQHFMLAQAALTQAESQMELAAMHRSRDIASRGRLGPDK